MKINAGCLALGFLVWNVGVAWLLIGLKANPPEILAGFIGFALSSICVYFGLKE